MTTKFKVVNVVATQNAGFHIDVDRVHDSEFLLYDTEDTQPNRYVAIRPPAATHQITIFHNGNMITVGNKSVAEARRNLELAKRFLKKFQNKQPSAFAMSKYPVKKA